MMIPHRNFIQLLNLHHFCPIALLAEREARKHNLYSTNLCQLKTRHSITRDPMVKYIQTIHLQLYCSMEALAVKSISVLIIITFYCVLFPGKWNPQDVVSDSILRECYHRRHFPRW